VPRNAQISSIRFGNNGGGGRRHRQRQSRRATCHGPPRGLRGASPAPSCGRCTQCGGRAETRMGVEKEPRHRGSSKRVFSDAAMISYAWVPRSYTVPATLAYCMDALTTGSHHARVLGVHLRHDNFYHSGCDATVCSRPPSAHPGRRKAATRKGTSGQCIRKVMRPLLQGCGRQNPGARPRFCRMTGCGREKQA